MLVATPYRSATTLPVLVSSSLMIYIFSSILKTFFFCLGFENSDELLALVLWIAILDKHVKVPAYAHVYVNTYIIVSGTSKFIQIIEDPDNRCPDNRGSTVLECRQFIKLYSVHIHIE